jgi:pyridoxine/pyridoxamine 5'-phosphate oxidase
MDNDAEVAEKYRDAVYSLKTDKEFDYDNLKRIHDRFDYFKDADKMHNVPKSKFDLKEDHKE